MIKIYDIRWDTDNECIRLPNEIVTDWECNDGILDYDKISDWLSSVYRFCHFGFKVREIERLGDEW